MNINTVTKNLISREGSDLIPIALSLILNNTLEFMVHFDIFGHFFILRHFT